MEGFIVQGRDQQYIAEAMLRVVRDPELWQRMGEAAHRNGAIHNVWQDYWRLAPQEYSKRLIP